MDYGSAFCERCGLDGDRLGSAGARDFRVCPDCSSSNCANCWNQVAGRCLACSPFHLATAPARSTGRIVPKGVSPLPVEATPSRPAAAGAPPSRASIVARAVPPESGIASGAGRLARRGLGKAVRVSLVAIIALVAAAGVRAVTLTGGAVAAEDPIGVETQAPQLPGASELITGSPEASPPGVSQNASEPPAERHHASVATSSSSAGGSGGSGSAGGNGANGGGGATPGVTPSPDRTGTPGPRGTPIPTPKPNPTITPTPAPTDPPTPAPTDPPTPAPTDPPTPAPTDPPSPEP